MFGSQEKFYDEMQVKTRGKIAFETMFLTFMLIFASTVVKTFFYVWATPYAELYILIGVPVFYFIVRSFLKDAYVPVNQSMNLSLILAAFVTVLGLLSILHSLRNGIPFIENGVLMDSASGIYLTILFGTVLVLLLYKKRALRKEPEEP